MSALEQSKQFLTGFGSVVQMLSEGGKFSNKAKGLLLPDAAGMFSGGCSRSVSFRSSSGCRVVCFPSSQGRQEEFLLRREDGY